MSDRQRFSTSYLLRLWEEPRRNGDNQPVLRLYLRNLKTGEERYVEDPGSLSGQMLAEFRQAEDPSSHANVSGGEPTA